MSFDPFTNQWFTVLQMKHGEEYLYKYITNDQHWTVNEDEPVRKDAQGNANNYGGSSIL